MSDVSKTNELIAEARRLERDYGDPYEVMSHMSELADALEAATRVPVQGEPNARVVTRSLDSDCALGVCMRGCSHLMWLCDACSSEGGWGATRDKLKKWAAEHVCPQPPAAQGEPNDDREALCNILIDAREAGDGLSSVRNRIIAAGFSRATVPDATFYGACGVELCETCRPLFDAANREIEGTGTVPDAAVAALERVRAIAETWRYGMPEYTSSTYQEGQKDQQRKLVRELLAALDGAPEPEEKP